MTSNGKLSTAFVDVAWISLWTSTTDRFANNHLLHGDHCVITSRRPSVFLYISPLTKRSTGELQTAFGRNESM